MNNISICVTGHRPNKLYGYDYNHPEYTKIKNRMENAIRFFIERDNAKEVRLISGMALGIDQIFCQLAIELRKKLAPEIKITLTAAVPCKEQDKPWKPSGKILYHKLLQQCDEIVMVSDSCCINKFDAARKMQDRNEWMVDHSNYVLAVYDGTKGGTANCYNYAKSRHKSIGRINPKLAPAKTVFLLQ